MRILMMTNIYTPYIGGVGKSISSFCERFEKRGHSYMIIAPKADEPVDDDESKVVRVATIKNFNDTNFPITIPLHGQFASQIEKFQPDIVHSHFPFISGSTAMRIAARYGIPLVFTYHTMYDRYLHYVNMQSDHVRNFVKTVTAGYANLCDLVIAPSDGLKQILCERGVTSRIEVVPTGVNVSKFKDGHNQEFRRIFKIPQDSFVLGHVGRLAVEKNLDFLIDAVIRFLKKHKQAHFLVVGDGPYREEIEKIIKRNKLKDKVVFTGPLKGQDLIDAYHSMNVFVFSSKAETQGMVLAEAMAAKIPVVALTGPGVTDILADGQNGFMVEKEDAELFADKIDEYLCCSQKRKALMKENAKRTADNFTIDKCADKVLQFYMQLTKNKKNLKNKDETIWHCRKDLIKAEWEIFCNYVNAVSDMVYFNNSNQK